MYIIRNLLRYITNTKCCISSSRWKIQPQGADEIQGRFAALDDIHDLRVIASRPSIHIVVAQRLRKSRLCRLLVRWTSFGKNSYQLFLPRHPTSTARRSITRRSCSTKSASRAKKKKHTTRVCFLFWLRGGGFFIALSVRVSHSIASNRLALLALGGLRFEKTVINCFSLAYPLPPPQAAEDRG